LRNWTPSLRNIPTLTAFYEETRAVAHANALEKGDNRVTTALKSRTNTEKQWSKQYSSTVDSQRIYDKAKETEGRQSIMEQSKRKQ
jgi:hypothetical protein